ncbi:MAG: hypothetical protein ACTSPY_02055 [Candidatus Helarchaeota archaeon]
MVDIIMFQCNLSLIEWLNGLTSLLIIIFAGLFGIFIFIRSKKQESSMLLFGALMGIFAGMLWLGPATDFLSVLITGKNLPNELIYGALTFMWVLPLFVCSMVIGGDLMFSKRKYQYILVVFSIILGIIFELFLFLDLDGAITDEPNPGGYALYDASIEIGHPTFYLIGIMLVFLFCFVVLGGLRHSIITTGALRKRFLYMSVAIFLFIPIAIIDAFFEITMIVIIIRSLMLFVAWLLYLSLTIKI